MRKPDRALGGLFYFCAMIMGAALLHIVQETAGLRPPHDDVSTADFIAIILSALGVMVAILTFFLAVLAVFGWTAFRTLIEDKFEDLFRKRFDANDPRYERLLDQVLEDARAKRAAEALTTKADVSDDADDEEQPDDEDAD